MEFPVGYTPVPGKYTVQQRDALFDRINAYPDPADAQDGNVPVARGGKVGWEPQSGGGGGSYVLTSNVTYYVDAASGNDANIGLSAENALKTIMAAVNKIPKVLCGYTATINVASGTYVETVSLVGLSAGRLFIQGADATISALYMQTCSIWVDLTCKAIVYDASIGASYPLIRAENGGYLRVRSSNLLLQNNGVGNGIYLDFGAKVEMVSIDDSPVTIKGCNIGIASVCGSTFVTNNTLLNIQDCSLGFNVYGGFCQITAAPSFANVKTQYRTVHGGRVYAGAQTSVPNY